VFAGLVARHAFEHAQRFRSGFTELMQRVQRQLPAGGLGGQVEDLVEVLRGRGLERGKQRGQGLADAGGCLRH